MQDISRLVFWVIEHEEELLAQLPPEKQAEAILASAKMRRGINQLNEFLDGLQHSGAER